MQPLELTLTGQAYLGRAFGRDEEGRVIFVPFGMQGERVRVSLVETHKRWALGKLEEVIEPSPSRIQPRCRHYTDCGGCHYQHLPYEHQLQVKRDVVHAQLERLGRIDAPPVLDPVASPTAWHTRNHMQFSLDPNGQLGFLAAGSKRVVPIQECFLPEQELCDLWPQIDLEPVENLNRLTLRTDSQSESLIVFHGQGDPGFDFSTDVAASAVWVSETGLTVLAGEDYLRMQVLDRLFHVSAGAFFQVHTALAADLVQGAIEALAIHPGDIIFDLYAGVGLFSAFIASEGARLIAVEESPWATADFERNLDAFDHVSLYAAPVEMALPSINVQPDAVLLDPPRAGLGAQVVDRLLALAPKRLVYVSCDPSTLARDGGRLREGGYHLEFVQPFDLFPQTFHIETLSLWTRNLAGS